MCWEPDVPDTMYKDRVVGVVLGIFGATFIVSIAAILAIAAKHAGF